MTTGTWILLGVMFGVPMVVIIVALVMLIRRIDNLEPEASIRADAEALRRFRRGEQRG